MHLCISFFQSLMHINLLKLLISVISLSPLHSLCLFHFFTSSYLLYKVLYAHMLLLRPLSACLVAYWPGSLTTQKCPLRDGSFWMTPFSPPPSSSLVLSLSLSISTLGCIFYAMLKPLYALFMSPQP